ncbi:MAG: tRNA-dihydrouridine synthase family protein [Spirochaetales bacterium]|nr:tRNA-dihydrouridine synthase family protein [Spirochaetales bacterium]MCF7938631.1 tRNA-dihydrouridine synthase family protein [Spirochaetales bacterium]
MPSAFSAFEADNPVNGYSSLIHPIQAGSLRVSGNIFLAPVAGYSDRAFRRLCREAGAYLTFTEMVSLEALARGSEGSLSLLKAAEGERPRAVQVFAGSPQVIEPAWKMIRRRTEELVEDFDLVDLNCGCPVPKVVKSGAGAALMQDPDRLSEIVAALSESTDKPVSVKLRSGWDEGSITYLEAAKAAVRSGAQMITLHPRTRKQGYSGAADWSLIRRLKDESEVPVIGSGDVTDPDSARRLLTETGCDGIMIARGAFGDPLLFQRIRDTLDPSPDTKSGQGAAGEAGTSGESRADPAIEGYPASRLSIALKHIDLAVFYLGKERAGKELKKHLAAYVKGIPGAAAFRDRLVRAAGPEEYRLILHEILAHASEIPSPPPGRVD